ncbi:hypothetical protein L6452_03982 [Arctium lappa]|uniref:Uncharacterized protein n=1 Tax=Arctium lappa TaxID=4217 RepID=A0ACB9FPQ3_ARCLA|nr:hypothetical protein L6452_03982 [Arctium lappa]
MFSIRSVHSYHTQLHSFIWAYVFCVHSSAGTPAIMGKGTISLLPLQFEEPYPKVSNPFFPERLIYVAVIAVEGRNLHFLSDRRGIARVDDLSARIPSVNPQQPRSKNAKVQDRIEVKSDYILHLQNNQQSSSGLLIIQSRWWRSGDKQLET